MRQDVENAKAQFNNRVQAFHKLSSAESDLSTQFKKERERLQAEFALERDATLIERLAEENKLKTQLKEALEGQTSLAALQKSNQALRDELTELRETHAQAVKDAAAAARDAAEEAGVRIHNLTHAKDEVRSACSTFSIAYKHEDNILRSVPLTQIACMCYLCRRLPRQTRLALSWSRHRHSSRSCNSNWRRVLRAVSSRQRHSQSCRAVWRG